MCACIAFTAVKSVQGVLHEPGASAEIDRVEETGIVLKVLAWVDQRRSDFGKTRSEAIRIVKEALEAEHVALAKPFQTVRVTRSSAGNMEDSNVALEPRKPTAAEVRSITDTGVDTTIKEKVDARREEAKNDLLTSAAPRE